MYFLLNEENLLLLLNEEESDSSDNEFQINDNSDNMETSENTDTEQQEETTEEEQQETNENDFQLDNDTANEEVSDEETTETDGNEETTNSGETENQFDGDPDVSKKFMLLKDYNELSSTINKFISNIEITLENNKIDSIDDFIYIYNGFKELAEKINITIIDNFEKFDYKKLLTLFLLYQQQTENLSNLLEKTLDENDLI